MLEKIRYLYYLKKDSSGTLYYRKMGVDIGDESTFIGDNINFGSEPYLIKIGNGVRVSYDVCFVTHDGGTFILRKENPNLCIYGPISVGDNTFIGARTIILPNVHIGNNVIIGAGSIVTKDIPSGEVWAGVPAKKICTLFEYKKKNENKFSYILNKNYKEKKKILLEYFDI